MLQNFSGEERRLYLAGILSPGWLQKACTFYKENMIWKKETVTVYANCLGYYRINDIKKRFGEPVVCGPGKQKFRIYAGMPAGVPSVRIEGETITSDRGWFADDLVSNPVPARVIIRSTARGAEPVRMGIRRKEYLPSEIRGDESGVLFVFETELTAVLKAEFPKDSVRDDTVLRWVWDWSQRYSKLLLQPDFTRRKMRSSGERFALCVCTGRT